MANAADRKSIRKQEKDARQAERLRRDAIVACMSTSQGRAWLWDVLASAHCFHTTHVAGDALASAFQEGRRSLGLGVLSDIMAHCPDLYIQAMREANDRYVSDNRNASVDDSSDPASASERRSSTLGDGRDSGAGADNPASAEALDDSDTAEWRSPGKDIYVDTPSGGST